MIRVRGKRPRNCASNSSNEPDLDARPDQRLAAIRKICDEMGADVVVIGATALLLSIGDLGRFTRDVDLTVALDLSEFGQLIRRLLATGWKQALRLEHRWVGPRQTIVDLLPAGPTLRRSGSILWPESQFRMSLSGFWITYLPVLSRWTFRRTCVFVSRLRALQRC